MNTIPGKITLLILIAAVLVYVVYSYFSGNSDLDYFIVAAAMLCFFLFQVGASLIRDLRSREK